MPTLIHIRRSDWLTLALILFVAALARLGDPGIVEFKLDEAWLTRLARTFASGGPLPLLGMPSSVGVPNPPASVYIMALPYALSSSPLVATLFVAALNVVGVGLLWLLAQRTLGRTVALVAGLMYALSPWAVYYSRKIWAQDLHTPFVLAALLLGISGFREGKRWAQVACLPVLIFAVQIHFAAWALLPLYAWLLWSGRRRIWWAGIALSVLLAGLTLLPYIAGLTQAGGTSGDISAVVGSSEPREVSGLALAYAADMTTGAGLEREIAGNDAGALLEAVPSQAALWQVLGLVTLVGLIAIWTARYRHIAGLVVSWAVLPVLVFTVPWTRVYPHYLIASIPAFCLLAGVSLDWLIARLPVRAISRSIVLVAFAALLLTQFMWWRGVMRYVAQGNAESFGVPLDALMPVRDVLLDQGHIVMLTDDARLHYSTPPAVWHAMLFGEVACFQALSGEDIVVYPPSPFAVLVAPDGRDIAASDYAMGTSLAYPAAPHGEYRLHLQISADAERLAWTELTPARFANGVELIGYGLDGDIVRLRWRTPAAADVRFQYFIHLLDENGDRIGQYDGPFLDGFYWCNDSAVVTRQRLNATPSATVLRVGMYRLVGDGFANADLVDAEGHSVAPWVDIPLR